MTLCADCHAKEHPFITEKIAENREAKKPTYCPRHGTAMRRKKILYGQEPPSREEDSEGIYTGDCFSEIHNQAGQLVRHGYVCNTCEAEIRQDPEVDNFNGEVFLLVDGILLPYEEAMFGKAAPNQALLPTRADEESE